MSGIRMNGLAAECIEYLQPPPHRAPLLQTVTCLHPAIGHGACGAAIWPMLISGLTKENDMKYPTIALTLVALAATQGPTAMAQDASARARDIFAKADTNQDGALSLEEWKAAGRRERGFSMIDADRDGKLTPEELRAAAAKYGK